MRQPLVGPLRKLVQPIAEHLGIARLTVIRFERFGLHRHHMAQQPQINIRAVEQQIDCHLACLYRFGGAVHRSGSGP